MSASSVRTVTASFMVPLSIPTGGTTTSRVTLITLVRDVSHAAEPLSIVHPGRFSTTLI